MRLSVVALALCLSACASSGKPLSQTDVSTIVPGKTTRAEMIQQFGAPTGQNRDPAGRLQANWIYFKHGFVGIGTKAQTMAVQFNPDETVAVVTYSGD